MITVGAIDDDFMLLEMLKNWMAAAPDIQLIHTAATVDEYIQLGVTNQIVLLDLNLKDDSSPAENVVRLTSLGSKVLVVSIIADQKYVIATLEAGAEGYLTKNHGPEALVTSIRQARSASVLSARAPSSQLLWPRHDTRGCGPQNRRQSPHRGGLPQQNQEEVRRSRPSSPHQTRTSPSASRRRTGGRATSVTAHNL